MFNLTDFTGKRNEEKPAETAEVAEATTAETAAAAATAAAADSDAKAEVTEEGGEAEMKTAETATATTTPKPSKDDVVVKENDTTTSFTPVEFPELLNRYLEGIAKNGDIM